METGEVGDGSPHVTTTDLRAFLGGSKKCRSPDVAAYIKEQRNVPDSAIAKWYQEFAKKAAAQPEHIDWQALLTDDLS